MDALHVRLEDARDGLEDSLEASASPLRREQSFAVRGAKTSFCVAAAVASAGFFLVGALWMGGANKRSSGWFENLSADDLVHCGRQIKWKAHPHLCLAVDGLEADDGVEVVIEKCGAAPHDEWIFLHEAKGSKVQLATKPSLCLDVRGGKNLPWTKMQLWSCKKGDAQDFAHAEDGALQWSKHDDKCLDVSYHSIVSGTFVQIAPCSANADVSMQSFVLDACHLNCPRQIRWMKEGKCLSVQGWHIKEGAFLQPGPCEGDGFGPSQFILNSSSGGGRMRLALNDKFCVAVNSKGELQLVKCDPKDADQEFELRQGTIYRSKKAQELVPAIPVTVTEKTSAESILVSACQLLYHPVIAEPIPQHLPCPKQLKWNPGWPGPPEALCMGTLQWHVGNGEPIVLAECEEGTQVGQRQHWILDTATGKIRLASSPNYCLETNHEATDSLPLHLWQCVDGDDKQVYDIPKNVLYHADSIKQGSRCLTVAETVVGETYAFAKLEMAPCGQNLNAQQRFAADVCEDDEKAEPPPENRLGSFLVIGDWGWDHLVHGNVLKADCQKAIGAAMAHKFNALQDVKFIINVGDSFYPDGLSSPGDIRWRTQWTNRYPDILRTVPWYSIYGNHDTHHDPGMCEDEAGAQLGDIRISGGGLHDRFYMPDYNWNIVHEDLSVEVVALDMNKYMDGWNQSCDAQDLILTDCQFASCPERCVHNAEKRAKQGMDLVFERHANSTAKNLLIFSHYPTDYFHSRQDFLDLLRDQSKREIAYFSGHRHNTDQWSTFRTGKHDWLVGGGGGWSCDGREQGFLVGTIDKNFQLRTYPVFVDADICCPTKDS